MNATELGAAARHFAAVERRLFELLGGWVTSATEPEVKVALRVESFRHAWHADLWTGLRGPNAMAEVAPGAAAESPAERPELLAVLAELTGTAERLEGLYRVTLPALVEDNRRRRDEAIADLAAGGPVARVLGLVLADHEAALASAERLITAAHANSYGGELPKSVELRESH